MYHFPLRGHVGVCGGILLFSPTVWAESGGVGVGQEARTHRNTTGTYTRMLHLPFSNLPFQKVPEPTPLVPWENQEFW